MKRIKGACLTQTICFSNKDGDTSAYARKVIEQEYEKYMRQLNQGRTKYQILSEERNEDGSIIIEIKKQYNSSPVGKYFD